ncbi:protein-disulfide reductase DsbD family protein [Porphyrobacter sp. LM 6]|uniref:protein-disulfide reductase DsbD family protein n=1 Tax=Porphyrobacter sp. LM 6 TaxID=1896196 RepID=UPI000846ED77|nr:thioredoxin family protein [Porphyrobacter sp. LM 6]AOL95394.1 Cytochrome C biogenesis protein transmembrane region [Porphyrobacter sp. LM 6]
MFRARNFTATIRQLLAWGLALLASALLAAPAMATKVAWPTEARFGNENIAVELFAEGAPQPRKEWLLALRFTPKAREWHGYWSNPGDAGQGMRLMLDLPDRWMIGEARYQVPERLIISGLMNHVYQGPYTVLVPISVPAGADVAALARVTGYVEYLACTDQICVPQDAVLASRPGGDFARWRAEAVPELSAPAFFDVGRKTLRLAIPLPAGVDLSDPHVFIGNEKLVDYAAPQEFRRRGDMLTVTIPLSEYRADDPSAVTGILAFGDGVGVAFGASPGDVPSGGEIVAGAKAAAVPPLWTLILGALAGGLLLNIMPCVFPILSLKALSLARAGESEAKARAEGLAYTAGVVIACVALGALLLALRAAGEQVGWAFQLQEPGVVVALLVLAAAITANFAGVFELPAISVSMGGERTGAFATGLLAAFVATPCTGPFMAAALGAALLLPVPQALLLFALLGLGLALPFLLLGFVPPLRRMLPKPGAWMERFRRIMAIPMALTALALVWLTVQLGGRPFGLIALVLVFGVLMALFVVGRLQRAGKMAWPAFGLVAAPFLVFALFALPNAFEAKGNEAEESLLAAQPFSRDALAAARASGKPVFVYFTADWCVTCKVNEAAAIERESTRAAFEQAGVVTLVGDWTVRDEAITAFLTEQGAAGVPLYLWYTPGASAPEQLPQVLTPDLLAAKASGSSRQADPAAGSD